MQIVDRIEKRRFVGREFLLWLWFESEIFEATLSTEKHGSFGLWVERQLALSSGKEVTRIKGGYPAGGREAKEALLAGKLPEVASLHITWRDRDLTLTLKAERLAVSGLKLPTVLDAEPEEPAIAAPPRTKKKQKRTTVEQDAEREADERDESFYERMALTREVESLVEALYGDFLALRLGESWSKVVHPALASWAAGERGAAVERYVATRRGETPKRSKTSKRRSA